MTASPDLVDVNGRSVPLAGQLGSGGEGAVFALLNSPSVAAKVYHRPPSAQTVQKLNAMASLANPQLLKLAAWPMGLLFHARTRQPAGFAMPLLKAFEPIQHLYNPVQRLKYYPRKRWNFQIGAAMNLAAALDEVHKAGCLVGDLNERNALVSNEALVRLIDCDSFQVWANGKPFLCEVGVAQYTPPELQGKSLRGLVRTENHDRFGLAVLIYQLLFVGRHPYAGIYRGSGDPTFEQLIAEYRFAQGPAAHTWGMSPPQYTPSLDDVTPELARLFRTAFERGSEAGTRPSPAQWLAALKQLDTSIVECPVDSGHIYWRGAGSCVWCRLAEHGGPEYYFGVSDGGVFVVDEAKLQEVLKRLNACGIVDFKYDRHRFAPSLEPEPEPLPTEAHEQHSLTVVLGAVGGLFALAIPLGLIHVAFCVGGLVGSLIFFTWLVIHISLSPWSREHRRRKRACQLAHDDLKEIEDKWLGRVERYQEDHSVHGQALRRLMSDCRDLASQYQADLHRLTVNAEAAARLRHLRLHLIADADIPKIGAGRKQILAAHNIFTAAEVDERPIREIKGFGDMLTSNLLMWRAEVLRQFQFDPARGISPGERRAVTSKCRNRQQQLMAEMDRELGRLANLEPECRDSLRQLVPEIRRAVAKYLQTEADLSLME